jgi:hypothetical protein
MRENHRIGRKWRIPGLVAAMLFPHGLGGGDAIAQNLFQGRNGGFSGGGRKTGLSDGGGGHGNDLLGMHNR